MPNSMMKPSTKRATFQVNLKFINLNAMLSIDPTQHASMDQRHTSLNLRARQLNKLNSKSTMHIRRIIFLLIHIQHTEISTKTSKLTSKNLEDAAMLSTLEVLEDLTDIQATMM